jgi:hypothetical protein
LTTKVGARVGALATKVGALTKVEVLELTLVLSYHGSLFKGRCFSIVNFLYMNTPVLSAYYFVTNQAVFVQRFPASGLDSQSRDIRLVVRKVFINGNC